MSLAGYGYPMAVTNFRLCIAIESPSGTCYLHFLDLSIVDSGGLVLAKLQSLSRLRGGWKAAMKRWISTPIICQCKVRRVRDLFITLLTPCGLLGTNGCIV